MEGKNTHTHKLQGSQESYHVDLNKGRSSTVHGTPHLMAYLRGFPHTHNDPTHFLRGPSELLTSFMVPSCSLGKVSPAPGNSILCLQVDMIIIGPLLAQSKVCPALEPFSDPSLLSVSPGRA